MENVTREIIADLYPLYVSGDATADTRRLVEAYLNEDPEMKRTLETGRDPLAAQTAPSLPPDLELKTLKQLKRKLLGPMWLMRFAILFSCFAFGRIVADTSFDVSPRGFIVTAAIAF